jgi:hypothetical protein
MPALPWRTSRTGSLFTFDLASEFRALWTLRHIYALAVRLRSLALPLKARKPQVESRVSEALHGMNA